jgi:methyl-accepting chemotaxis protein
MPSLSLKTKFIGLSLLTVAMMALVGGLALFQLHTLTELEIERQSNTKAILLANQKIMDARIAFKLQVQHWKNILLRGNNPADFSHEQSAFLQYEARVQFDLRHAAEIRNLPQSSQDEISALIQDHAALGEIYKKILRQFDVRDPQSGKEIDTQVRGIDQPLTDALSNKVDTLAQHYQAMQEQDAKDSLDNLRGANQQIWLFIVAGMLILTGLMYWILRSVLRQIGGDPSYAEDVAKAVAAGDLSIRIPAHTKPSVLSHLQVMVEELSEHIIAANQTCITLDQLSQHLEQSAAQLAKNAQEQAVAVEQNSASLEQITATVQQNTLHSQILARLVDISPEISDLIDEINYASKEQAATLQYASSNLLRLANNTQQNALQAEYLSRTASRLTAQTRYLFQMIDHFKTA